MELLEYIFCCVFITIFILAFTCAASYGLMWFIRLIIITIRAWKKEDGRIKHK